MLELLGQIGLAAIGVVAIIVGLYLVTVVVVFLAGMILSPVWVALLVIVEFGKLACQHTVVPLMTRWRKTSRSS